LKNLLASFDSFGALLTLSLIAAIHTIKHTIHSFQLKQCKNANIFICNFSYYAKTKTNIMNKFVFTFSAVSMLATATLVSCNSSDTTKVQVANSQEIRNDSLVKRGNYLVSAVGCDDCHSPKTMGPQGPQLDMEHRLSGYPAQRPLAKVDANAFKSGWMLFGGDLTSAVGPWGVSFAANITSDSTGIGNWSEAQFFTAMRKGKFKGLESNRDLLPPMPWQNFRNFTDEDLQAIFAYLKSTKPVHNPVPAPIPPTNL
jgi:hypothetical protein